MYSIDKHTLWVFASALTALVAEHSPLKAEDANRKEVDFQDQDRNYRDMQRLTGCSEFERENGIDREPQRDRDSNRHRESDSSRQPNDPKFVPDNGK